MLQRVYYLFAQIDLKSLPNRGAGDPAQSALQTALSIIFAISGSVALLVIVIGGFRYILAHGDSNAVAQARNTILYAVIGLVVSLAAFSIVTFVIKGVG